jgi:hypothetical protein
MKKTDIIYLGLGGSDEAMKLRLGALVAEFKSRGAGLFLVTGFEDEIQLMKYFLEKEKGVNENSIKYTYSYDTLSNLQSCLSTLEKADMIIVATSPLHWERVDLIISRYFPQLRKKFQWIDSHEKEVGYAKVGLWIYKIFGPERLQKISILTRWERFKREYSEPLWKKGTE